MKNLIIGILLSFCLFAQDNKAVAIVVKSEGDVTISQNGKKVTLSKGTKIYDDNQIITGSNASVAFRFLDDKSLVRVRQNSSFKVQGKREASGSINKNISLEIGDILASVAKQKGQFRVTTPNGVASVKGTVFGVMLDESGETVTYCYEGSVGVANKDGVSTDATAGKIVVTKKDGTQTTLPLSEENTKKFNLNTKDEDLGGDFNLELEYENDKGQTKKVKININGN
jgi:hypothetical protein